MQIEKGQVWASIQGGKVKVQEVTKSTVTFKWLAGEPYLSNRLIGEFLESFERVDDSKRLRKTVKPTNDIKSGQVWGHIRLNSFVEVVDVTGSNVKFKFLGSESGLIVLENIEVFEDTFYYVRDKGDVTRGRRFTVPNGPVTALDFDDKGVITGVRIDTDAVNHPSHYTSHPSGIECIDVTRHMGFNAGNVIKYLWRNGLKDGEPSLKDLKKARWYLDDLIKQMEKLPNADNKR